MKKITRTANFYGFVCGHDHIKDLEITKQDIIKAKTVLKKHPSSLISEKIALIRMFVEKKMANLSQPVMIYYKSLIPEKNTLNLDIIGNPKSIADAILIETSYIISKEEYEELDISVEVNTLGDRESLGRLERELNSYYKKHWSSVPKNLKAEFKKDIFNSFRVNNKELTELRSNGPDPIRCLSEQSRQHFKEVLDYIENLKIPYSINYGLLGDISYGTETVFEIIGTDKNNKRKVLVEGQRYNSIARKFLGKKEVAAIGAKIALKVEKIEFEEPKKESKPKFFFIQLGQEAKLQSLLLLEVLRKANMKVYQSLTKDKMTVQLAQAEKMEIPYIIIMGKKEALDGCVLVRHLNTRCQDTVMLDNLVEYVKGLK